METITITIYPTSNDGGGFAYNIYDVEAELTIDGGGDIESIDGGQCTSDNIADALEMATSQALDLIRYRDSIELKKGTDRETGRHNTSLLLD